MPYDQPGSGGCAQVAEEALLQKLPLDINLIFANVGGGA